MSHRCDSVLARFYADRFTQRTNICQDTSGPVQQTLSKIKLVDIMKTPFVAR